MLTIDHTVGVVPREALEGKENDTLVLTAEQRRWLRGQFKTARGRELGLAFPTGTTLEPGTLLWIEPGWYLTVEAAPEPVLMIFPGSRREAIKIAFEVGNRHFPLAVEGDALFVPDDPAMANLLDRLGASWQRRSAAFDPIGNAHRHDH